mmetsp:Transcript_10422/g.23867  ORF Transcript_10422/g.23867 Transcript_10422/m.23867 type:complete len:203 (+) Transcript_10422:1297-1905(+)
MRCSSLHCSSSGDANGAGELQTQSRSRSSISIKRRIRRVNWEAIRIHSSTSREDHGGQSSRCHCRKVVTCLERPIAAHNGEITALTIRSEEATAGAFQVNRAGGHRVWTTARFELQLCLCLLRCSVVLYEVRCSCIRWANPQMLSQHADSYWPRCVSLCALGSLYGRVSERLLALCTCCPHARESGCLRHSPQHRSRQHVLL